MTANQPRPQPPLRIGISSCLLGEAVRFDGGHKRDRFLTDTLGAFVEWVPVCPEMEIGLGVPRDSLRLIGDEEDYRLIVQRTGEDLTPRMDKWASTRLEQLERLDLHGYILKKDSPSCGMERVRIYHRSQGGAVRRGVGIFARALLERMPLLPVEEEGRLNDMKLRENFIDRVFAYYRWTQHFEERASRGELVRFHTIHKLTILSHSPKHYRELGRIVANMKGRPIREVLDEYGRLFMEALRLRATPRKHVNVLQHLQGFLKNALDKQDKTELSTSIEHYRQGLVPLVVPLTLLQHHLRKHPDPWALDQTYLNPYPLELLLRNHV